MKRMRVVIGLIAIAATAGSVAAASNEALERALIGRRVMVPFDMPVNSLGVEFDGDHGFARNDEKRLERISMWGTSVMGGEIAVITGVRVHKNRIEILLGRGGLTTTRLLGEQNPHFRIGNTASVGTDADPHSMQLDARSTDERERLDAAGSQSVVRPPTPDSRAEYARTVRAVGDTLGDAEASRLIEGSRLYRANVGSRLRILFHDEVPPGLLEPRALMLALSEHVMFVRESTDVAPGPDQGTEAPEPPDTPKR